MVHLGDNETYYREDDSMGSDYVTGSNASEEDPFAALDDFAAEENEEEVLDTESAMGKEYGEAPIASDEEDSHAGTAQEIKAEKRQLTPEEIERIKEKNKREKKLTIAKITKSEKALKKSKKSGSAKKTNKKTVNKKKKKK